MTDKLSALGIQSFIAERLPYYESDDKDDFIYLVKQEDLQRLAVELETLFHEIQRSREITISNFGYNPYNKERKTYP